MINFDGLLVPEADVYASDLGVDAGETVVWCAGHTCQWLCLSGLGRASGLPHGASGKGTLY